MKFPWQRRADVARAHRVVAEKRLEDVRADWPHVRREASGIRRQRELNGWTETIVAIFGTPQQRRHP